MGQGGDLAVKVCAVAIEVHASLLKTLRPAIGNLPHLGRCSLEALAQGGLRAFLERMGWMGARLRRGSLALLLLLLLLLLLMLMLMMLMMMMMLLLLMMMMTMTMMMMVMMMVVMMMIIDDHGDDDCL